MFLRHERDDFPVHQMRQGISTPVEYSEIRARTMPEVQNGFRFSAEFVRQEIGMSPLSRDVRQKFSGRAGVRLPDQIRDGSFRTLAVRGVQVSTSGPCAAKMRREWRQTSPANRGFDRNFNLDI